MNAEQRRELANPAIRDGLVMVTGERNTLRTRAMCHTRALLSGERRSERPAQFYF